MFLFYHSLFDLYSYRNFKFFKLKICATTAGIKKYRSIIKKKIKKHNKMALLAKAKLYRIKVLFSKALINSNIVIMNSF